MIKKATVGAGGGGFRRSRNRRAFSLVEVVLAMGIASFALLVMVALVPVGIKSTKDSLEETGGINLLSSLIADRKATPFGTTSILYSLPALTPSMASSPSSFGVTASNTNTTSYGLALYRVTYQFTPPPTGSLTPYQAYFKVSWPALASTAPAGYVEQVVTFPQP